MNNQQAVNFNDMSVLYTYQMANGGYNDFCYEQLWKANQQDAA